MEDLPHNDDRLRSGGVGRLGSGVYGWGVGVRGMGRMSHLPCGESSLWRIFCGESSVVNLPCGESSGNPLVYCLEHWLCFHNQNTAAADCFVCFYI